MLLDIVRAKCEEKNMSIAALEKEAGIANATIRGWDKSSPRIDTLQKVAAVLGCSIDELVNEEQAAGTGNTPTAGSPSGHRW